jgi:hypothetical protein
MNHADNKEKFRFKTGSQDIFSSATVKDESSRARGASDSKKEWTRLASCQQMPHVFRPAWLVMKTHPTR